MRTLSEKHAIFLILCLIFGLITGCTMDSPTPTPGEDHSLPALTTPLPGEEFIPLATLYPDCHPDRLHAVELIYPIGNEIIDSTAPIFSWSDPDDCPLESYEVHYQEYGSGTAWYGNDIPYPEDSAAARPELNPGSHYLWNVLKVISSVPSAGGGRMDNLGPQSFNGSFFTGPYCAADELAAPLLVAPEDGALIHPGLTSAGIPPTLIWNNPSGCLPDQYHLQISREADFSELTIDVITESPMEFWEFDRILEEETVYYWQVASVKDGIKGPDSLPFQFTTESLAPGTPALITGMVWEDECINPIPRDEIPAGYTLPDGCQSFEELVIADGIREPGEHGIYRAALRISTGSCPPGDGERLITVAITEDDYPWTPEDETGIFHAYVNPGNYCVFLNRPDAGNERFYHGIWSYPDPLNPPMQEVVIDRQGEVAQNINFGWDDDGAGIMDSSSLIGRVWFDRDGDGIPDPAEPGIPGLEIFLTEGECRSNWEEYVLNSQFSSSSGEYAFPDLLPGSFCLVTQLLDSSLLEQIRIIEPDPPHIPAGLPGAGQSGGYQVYSSSAGLDADPEKIQIQMDMSEQLILNLGWVNWPIIQARQSTSCILRSGEDYIKKMSLEQGDSRYLIGRKEDNSWWLSSDECWIPASQVAFFGDPDVLPDVIDPDPPPSDPEQIEIIQPSHPTSEVDQGAPSISIRHRPSNPGVNDRITISVTSYDDQHVAKISIYLGSFETTPLKSCFDQTNCSAVIGPYLPPKTITYLARSWDASGNMVSSERITFSIKP